MLIPPDRLLPIAPIKLWRRFRFARNTTGRLHCERSFIAFVRLRALTSSPGNGELEARHSLSTTVNSQTQKTLTRKFAVPRAATEFKRTRPSSPDQFQMSASQPGRVAERLTRWVTQGAVRRQCLGGSDHAGRVTRCIASTQQGTDRASLLRARRVLFVTERGRFNAPTGRRAPFRGQRGHLQGVAGSGGGRHSGDKDANSCSQGTNVVNPNYQTHSGGWASRQRWPHECQLLPGASVPVREGEPRLLRSVRQGRIPSSRHRVQCKGRRTGLFLEIP